MQYVVFFENDMAMMSLRRILSGVATFASIFSLI